MGRIDAVFKADGAETGAQYSISEWWLEPRTTGPGAHSHPEDDIFYVIAGTMSVLVGDEWTDAAPGSFVLIPGGVTHDFENRGEVRAGVLNFYAPGTFEEHMPEIARWWRDHPPKDTSKELGSGTDSPLRGQMGSDHLSASRSSDENANEV
jgi:mannose-6-phosphate isomerase-like protein (cupin superfamily)